MALSLYSTIIIPKTYLFPSSFQVHIFLIRERTMFQLLTVLARTLAMFSGNSILLEETFDFLDYRANFKRLNLVLVKCN